MGKNKAKWMESEELKSRDQVAYENNVEEIKMEEDGENEIDRMTDNFSKFLLEKARREFFDFWATLQGLDTSLRAKKRYDEADVVQNIMMRAHTVLKDLRLAEEDM